jgi:hypothetical protein
MELDYTERKNPCLPMSDAVNGKLAIAARSDAFSFALP